MLVRSVYIQYTVVPQRRTRPTQDVSIINFLIRCCYNYCALGRALHTIYPVSDIDMVYIPVPRYIYIYMDCCDNNLQTFSSPECRGLFIPFRGLVDPPIHIPIYLRIWGLVLQYSRRKYPATAVVILVGQGNLRSNPRRRAAKCDVLSFLGTRAPCRLITLLFIPEER